MPLSILFAEKIIENTEAKIKLVTSRLIKMDEL
jgi:hypothetical protein